MSPALNGNSMLEHFERSNVSEIRNGIMFDFYPGLPHMVVGLFGLTTYCKFQMNTFTPPTVFNITLLIVTCSLVVGICIFTTISNKILSFCYLCRYVALKGPKFAYYECKDVS